MEPFRIENKNPERNIQGRMKSDNIPISKSDYDFIVLFVFTHADDDT